MLFFQIEINPDIDLWSALFKLRSCKKPYSAKILYAILNIF